MSIERTWDAAIDTDRFGAPARWVAQAACLGVGNEPFFVGRGESQAPARAVCARCPVVAECAEAGKDEAYGIWGNKSRRQRKLLRGPRTSRWTFDVVPEEWTLRADVVSQMTDGDPSARSNATNYVTSWIGRGVIERRYLGDGTQAIRRTP